MLAGCLSTTIQSHKIGVRPAGTTEASIERSLIHSHPAFPSVPPIFAHTHLPIPLAGVYLSVRYLSLSGLSNNPIPSSSLSTSCSNFIFLCFPYSYKPPLLTYLYFTESLTKSIEGGNSFQDQCALNHVRIATYTELSKGIGSHSRHFVSSAYTG